MARSRYFSRTQRTLGDTPELSPESALVAVVPAVAFEPEVTLTPEWSSVRSARIERARRLVQNPDYPSSDVLRSVAGLLARHLAEGK
jgi:hypothetical protein